MVLRKQCHALLNSGTMTLHQYTYRILNLVTLFNTFITFAWYAMERKFQNETVWCDISYSNPFLAIFATL